jgi:hypothetical protein
MGYVGVVRHEIIKVILVSRASPWVIPPCWPHGNPTPPGKILLENPPELRETTGAVEHHLSSMDIL